MVVYVIKMQCCVGDVCSVYFYYNFIVYCEGWVGVRVVICYFISYYIIIG